MTKISIPKFIELRKRMGLRLRELAGSRNLGPWDFVRDRNYNNKTDVTHRRHDFLVIGGRGGGV